MKTRILALSFVAVSLSAGAQAQTCKPIEEFMKGCEAVNFDSLGKCGNQILSGLMKGGEWTVKSYQEMGEMVGKGLDAMGKGFQAGAANATKAGGEFIAAMSQGTGNNINYLMSGKAMTDSMNWFSDAQKHVAKVGVQNALWEANTYLPTQAGKAIQNSKQVQDAVKATVKTADDIAKASGSAIINGSQAMAKAQADIQKLGMEKYLAKVGDDAKMGMMMSLVKYSYDTKCQEIDKETGACKTPFKGCPTCKQAQEAACYIGAASSTYLAADFLTNFIPGAMARYGAKGAVWSAKGMKAVGGAVNKMAKAGEAIARSTKVGDKIADGVVHSAQAVGHGAKVAAEKTAQGAHALAQTEGGQKTIQVAQAVGAGTAKGAQKVVSGTIKTAQKIGEVPGIKQVVKGFVKVNKCVDDVCELVMDGGEVVLAKTTKLFGKEVVADNLAMKRALEQLAKKGGQLVAVKEGTKVVLKSVDAAGNVLETMDVVDAAKQAAHSPDITMSWDDWQTRGHERDLAKVSGNAVPPHAEGRHVALEEAVEGHEGARYVKPVEAAEGKDHEIRQLMESKGSPKPTGGDEMINTLAAGSGKQGKRVAYVEDLKKIDGDEFSEMYQDKGDVILISRKGLQAADNAIHEEAEAAVIAKMKEKYKFKSTDPEAEERFVKAHRKEIDEATDVESRKLGREKGNKIADCEECMRTGRCRVEDFTIEKALTPPTGHN